MTTLDGRGDDRRTLERVDPAASRVSLYWRVFAVNAAILSVAVLLLIVTPIAIDPQPTRGQLVILVGGTARDAGRERLARPVQPATAAPALLS